MLPIPNKYTKTVKSTCIQGATGGVAVVMKGRSNRTGTLIMVTAIYIYTARGGFFGS